MSGKALKTYYDGYSKDHRKALSTQPTTIFVGVDAYEAAGGLVVDT
jgi:hypothetical protein